MEYLDLLLPRSVQDCAKSAPEKAISVPMRARSVTRLPISAPGFEKEARRQLGSGDLVGVRLRGFLLQAVQLLLRGKHD